MFLKLLKYDFKYLLKFCLPIYGIGILLACVNSLIKATLTDFLTASMRYEHNFINFIRSTFVTLSQFFIYAIAFVVFIYCIMYFSKSLYSKLGYLTNTLPVTNHNLVLSKLLSTYVIMILTCFVVLLCFSIYFFEDIFFYDFFDYIEMFIDLFNYAFGLDFIISLLFILISPIGQILIIYASISIGHLFKKSTLSSFIFYIVLQNIFNPTYYILLLADMRINFTTSQIIFLLAQSIPIIGCYIITTYILKNKLNLQ